AAADVRAEPAYGVGIRDGRVERSVRVRILATQINVALRRADGDAGNRHAFEQAQRIAFHQHAVGERARVAFVGVADDVFLFSVDTEHGVPLDAGRERR